MPEDKVTEIRNLVVYKVDNGFTVKVEFSTKKTMFGYRTFIAPNLDAVHSIINEWFALLDN